MKKRITIVLAMLMLFGSVLPMSIFAYDPAYDNEVQFEFTIWPFQLNSNSSSRYRSTTNIYNTWKVNLQTSTEGAGTYTRFWLEEDFNFANVSPSLDVRQGSGDHYYYTYSSASQEDVCLAAENNNYGNTSYYVTGYWDEETTRDWRYDF